MITQVAQLNTWFREALKGDDVGLDDQNNVCDYRENDHNDKSH